MRRSLCFLLFFTVFMLCFGCSPRTDSDPFSVFYTDISLDGELVCNGNASAFTAVLENGGENFSVRVTSPEEASGYLFTRNGEGYNLSFGDISVECSEQLSSYPEMLRVVLSPSSDVIVSISAESQDGQTLTSVETADIKYLFTSDGEPFSASGVACGKSFELRFTRFEQSADGE